MTFKGFAHIDCSRCDIGVSGVLHYRGEAGKMESMGCAGGGFCPALCQAVALILPNSPLPASSRKRRGRLPRRKPTPPGQIIQPPVRNERPIVRKRGPSRPRLQAVAPFSATVTNTPSTYSLRRSAIFFACPTRVPPSRSNPTTESFSAGMV